MQLWQITRKIHTSWLIAIASASIVVGVAAVPLVSQAWFGAGVWLALSMGLIAVSLWRRVVYLVPLVIVGGLVMGLWRGSLMQSELSIYENLIGKSAIISGSVTDDPDIGKHGELLLRLGQVMINGHVVGGTIWVNSKTNVDVKRGDHVTVTGKLTSGFGSFAVTVYQAKLVKLERPEPGDVARRARDWFGERVRLAISEPQASLGLGYLLGQRRAMPPELDQALVVAGLTHIVVASGYNLTILVRFARRLFVKVSKYLAALSASVMILAFIAVTGASPSMSRAGLVAGLSLAAWYYGRRFHPLIVLPFAAAVTVLVNPSYAWDDLGWQLSFMAFAGVMIVAPLLQRYFFGDKKPGTVRQILGETISAQIVTAPLLIVAFGTISNVAIIANLLILPLVPLAMMLTFIAGIVGTIAPGIAVLVGSPAELLLTYMIEIAQYFAGLPWAQNTIQISVWAAIVLYAAVIAICIYLQRATKYDLKSANIIE